MTIGEQLDGFIHKGREGKHCLRRWSDVGLNLTELIEYKHEDGTLQEDRLLESHE